MVDKIKTASRTTVKTVENLYEVVSLGAILAAAVKVANLTKVQTGAGQFPVWQLITAVLIAGVSYRVFSLLNKAQ